MMNLSNNNVKMSELSNEQLKLKIKSTMDYLNKLQNEMYSRLSKQDSCKNSSQYLRSSSSSITSDLSELLTDFNDNDDQIGEKKETKKKVKKTISKTTSDIPSSDDVPKGVTKQDIISALKDGNIEYDEKLTKGQLYYLARTNHVLRKMQKVTLKDTLGNIQVPAGITKDAIIDALNKNKIEYESSLQKGQLYSLARKHNIITKIEKKTIKKQQKK